MAIDPICKMTVDEDTAEWKSEHDGKAYYFCAPGCKSAFEENPEKYMGEKSGSAETHHDNHGCCGGQSGDKKPWWKVW